MKQYPRQKKHLQLMVMTRQLQRRVPPKRTKRNNLQKKGLKKRNRHQKSLVRMHHQWQMKLPQKKIKETVMVCHDHILMLNSANCSQGKVTPQKLNPK